MTATHWMKMLGIGVLATGIGTSLVWLATPTAVQAQVQGVEKPKPPAEAKKPTDEKPEQKEKIIVVMKRLETIKEVTTLLEEKLKITKEKQLDESTLSDFTLRKLIEETEMKMLGLNADERKLEELIKLIKQQAKTEQEYAKLIQEEKFDEIKFLRLMRIEGGIVSEWAKLSTSSDLPEKSTMKSLLEKHKELNNNKRLLEQIKDSRSSPNKDQLERFVQMQAKAEASYKITLEESAKPGSIELIKLADDSINKVQDALKRKLDTKKTLTTQRKDYLRALAKLTDNTETTKIQHELDILRDQKALLSRVLLRLELEAQGITITPEDVPVKKEK